MKKTTILMVSAAIMLWLYKMKRGNDIDLIARTAWGEDWTGGDEGMQAVINVIQNRVNAGGWFGNGWRGVILKPYQFSIWNARTTEQYKDDPEFKKALEKITSVDEKTPSFKTALNLAGKAYNNQLPDITNGATHYKTPAASASWAAGKTPVAYAGNHVFYIV